MENVNAHVLWFDNGNRCYTRTNRVLTLTYLCSTQLQVPQRENVNSPTYIGGKVKFLCLIKHRNIISCTFNFDTRMCVCLSLRLPPGENPVPSD